MKGRLAVVALGTIVLAMAGSARAQQVAPRDIWTQATAAAREGDFDSATKKRGELLAAGRSYGVRRFPAYAAGAAAMASESTANAALVEWGRKTAGELDARSSAAAFNEADRIARTGSWSGAVPLAAQGLLRVFKNYRGRVLSRADLVIVACAAVLVTFIALALALFIRYGRSMAHDFRESVSVRFSGGSVSVLAFALLFLPLFLWLGPMWLLFYWVAIFFGYAGKAERIAAVILLVLVALIPVVVDAMHTAIAGLDSPGRGWQPLPVKSRPISPDALRRLQELLAVVPDDPLAARPRRQPARVRGEGRSGARFTTSAQLSCDPRYAGAHVNRGNLYFLNNEYQAAMNEYQRRRGVGSETGHRVLQPLGGSGEIVQVRSAGRRCSSERARPTAHSSSAPPETRRRRRS